MTNIQTLTTVTEAQAALAGLAESHEWVSVFWDKRDRRTPEISIMVDGDGADPKAWIAKEVYAALVDSGTVGEDTYGGFHARRIHDYCVPPAPEKTGPTANEVIEEVLRRLFADRIDLPLKTSFFRGINKGNVFNPINEETLTTPAYGSVGYVNISPGAREAHISAWEAGYFGDKVSGVTIEYPRNGDEVDVEALRSMKFLGELLAAISSQFEALDARAT